ncbi:hypothetical protein KUTeg_005311 [Tegillarca granosa]|uniref:Peptidase S54 rhomboid domain-containing protein n=1 Tax=Tegillarca granosa TaxID=220873 RepID=A0ABQ9FJC5_TEGGR|nr:hypothetical protein KUTeg_005311 [Tegillarca granosa]
MSGLWKRFKTVGRSVARRIGIFFGIVRSDELDDIQDIIQQRLQDGEYGISINNLFPKKSSNKYRLASQVEEALSQVLMSPSNDDVSVESYNDFRLQNDFEVVETRDSEISISMESLHLENPGHCLEGIHTEQSNQDSDLMASGYTFDKNIDNSECTPVKDTEFECIQVEKTGCKNCVVQYAGSDYAAVESIYNECNTPVEDIGSVCTPLIGSECTVDPYTIEVKEANSNEICNLYPSNKDQSNSTLRKNDNPVLDKNKSANGKDNISDDSESKKSDKVTFYSSKLNNTSKSKSESSVLVTSTGNSVLAEVDTSSDGSNIKVHFVVRSKSEGANMDDVMVERNKVHGSSDDTDKDDLTSESELNNKSNTDTRDNESKDTVCRSSVSIESINVSIEKNIRRDNNVVKLGSLGNSVSNVEDDSDITKVTDKSATHLQLEYTNQEDSRETLKEDQPAVNKDVSVLQNSVEDDKRVEKHVKFESLTNTQLEDTNMKDSRDTFKKDYSEVNEDESAQQDNVEDDKKMEKHVEFESLTRTQECELNDKALDDFGETDNNPNSMQWDNKSDSEEQLNEEDFAYGQEAYHHYKLFAEIEKKIKIGELEESKERKVNIYKWNIEQIDEIIEKAKAYYMDPTGEEPAKDWKELWKKFNVELKSKTSFHKYPKSITDIRVKLSEMPVYLPLFTIFIIFAQLVSFGVICGLGGLTYIGLEPKLELQDGIKTFLGTETVHKWVRPNIWIGPSEVYMISVGATFSPCMREDIGIIIDSTKMNYSVDTRLGCCEVASRNTAGTTTQDECTQLTNGVGKWKENMMCSERPSGQNHIQHNLKPCCINTKGMCTLMSHKHCTFIGGIYHQKGPEHCSKVNCLSSVCGFGGFTSKPDQTWLPDKPAHWWRFLLSLLYHHGIIHTALVVIIQALILRQIEQSVGWFRVMIIYILSGVGGILPVCINYEEQNMVDLIIIPVHVSVGLSQNEPNN